jgi:hypothetical protein
MPDSDPSKAAAARQRYQKLKRGLCVNHPDTAALPGRVFCQECTDKYREQAAKRYRPAAYRDPDEPAPSL